VSSDITKLFITQFSPLCCYSFLVDLNIYLSNLNSHMLSLCCFLNVTDLNYFYFT